MSIFRFLSEAKIRDWLKRKSAPDYVPPPPVDKTAFGKSFEGHLLDEIKELILAAYREPDPEKRRTLEEKATNLEIRLTLSYEQQGYPLLAKRTQDEIQQYRNTIRAP